MGLLNKSHEHLDSVKESYFEHLGVAMGFSGRLLCASAAVFIHALIPALFQYTGSRIIRELHGELQSRMNHAHKS